MCHVLEKWGSMDLNSLPNDNFLDWIKLKAFADNNKKKYVSKIADNNKKCVSKIKICFGKGRKYFGKRRKCWLSAFSPFPKMFSKAFFFKIVNSRDCVVKG